MVSDRHKQPAEGLNAVLKTARPKLFRRASITSWGKDGRKMTRTAADVNLKEFMLTVQQQKYEDEDKAAQREISRTVNLEHQEKIRGQRERRERWLQRSHEKKDFIIKWEREGRSKWSANQAALCRYERRLLNYELAVRETAVARRRISRARHATDVVEGIRCFEENLDRLGLDAGCGIGGAGDGLGPRKKSLLPDVETGPAFRSRLLRKVLDQRFVPASNAETMAELHFKGNAARRARQERENRRVMSEVVQRNAKRETDAQRSADDHLRSLLEKGQRRRKIAASFWEREQTREAKAEVRRERSVNKSVTQQAAFETAFNVRAASIRVRHAALSEDREARSDAMRARRESAREEKRRRTESLCLAIAQKIADLAVIASEARMNQDGTPLSPTVWKHLKRWFCSADPFFPEESSSEPQPEPHDSVLEAKAYIEGRNLDQSVADWRPQGVACTGLPPPPSPLEEALSVAWELVGATGPGPREAPMHKALQSDDSSDIGPNTGSMSVRMVVLGKREGLHDVCADLGQWVNLYVCSVDSVLECAMEIGAEVVSSNAKSVKGQRGSTARKDATKSKHKGHVGGGSGNGVSVEDSEVLAETEADAKTKAEEVIACTTFDPDASEEHVAAFKEAAAAYFALRTHPKKSDIPVPVATTVDLLVKHLSCRAPKGRGWILVGYPRTLIESKMLEHALSGYTDEDVEVELGGGGKKGRKKKRGTALDPMEQPEVPRSGLDAIVNLVRMRPDVEDEVSQANDENVEEEATSSSTKDIDGHQQEKVRNEGHENGSNVGKDCEEDVADIDAAEASGCRAWWEGFEGGHLACDVQDEASDERLLETLFLLANAAQKRKNECEISRQNDEVSTEQFSVEGTTTEPFTNSGEECADPQPKSNTAEIIDPVSPLAVPLTTLLEDLRRERRAGMSHATRIRVEVLAGERSLDLQGVWSVISRADALVGNESGASTSPWMKAMRKMESICGASSVVDWAVDVEHAFARGLRSSDDGWVTACVRLEDELVEWLDRFDKTTEGATAGRRERWGRRTVGGLKSGGGGGNVTSFDLTTWEVLEEFELAAGDVADDRHASAEVTIASIDSEATQRVHSWAENAARSAMELCATERLRYREVVRALCDLHRLIGLRHDCSPDSELTALSARVAADALEKEVTAVSERQLFSDSSRRGLAQELSSAIEEAHLQGETHCIPRDNTDAESGNPGSSSDRAGSAAQEAIAQDGRGTQEVDCVRAETYLSSESATSGASLDAEEGAHEEEGCERSLTTAVWRCREIYVSRCRGVVARLVIAVTRCETVVAAMLAALRCLNRRRVQLEHGAVAATTLAVRRSLEEYNYVAIREILENSIPLCVEDNETFAADPHVALPWGMSGLDLDQIASLAHALRSTFTGASGGESGIPYSTVPVKDLARAVLAWSDSAAIERRGIRSMGGNQVPPVWVRGTGGYVEALCRAVGTEAEAGRVPWRRLIHCLLLGHIRSVPSLEDLRSMRHSFTREESWSFSPAGLSIGAHSSRPNSASVTAAAGGETVAASANASDITQQQQQLEIPSVSLRVEQRRFRETPLWFETEEKSEDDEAEDATAAASAIKTVYAETWTAEDGRLDGMDLLLTLCTAPTAYNNAMSASRNGGIPFSLGLFRAFMMLAEAPDVTLTRDLTTTGATASAGCIPDVGKRLPATITSTSSTHVRRNSRESRAVIGATALKPVDDQDAPQRDFSRRDPRVTLPFLRAILLEHGVGLSPAEVSGVFEAAARDQRRVELKKKVLQQNVGDHGSESGSAAISSGNTASEVAGSVAYERGNADLTGRANGDEGSAPGAEKVEIRRDESAQSAGAEVPMDRERDTTKDVPDAVERGERKQPDPQHEDPSRVIDGEGVSSRSDGNLPLEEPEPLPTVSFIEACECETVRAWVRRGAYSLPPFEVTSGRRTCP